jgi:hypothetical protein
MTCIDVGLRRLVIARARNRCEYCLLSQEESSFTFHIEHILAEKHGGETQAENLCFSCPKCNLFKGSDIGSIDPETGILTPLFNPRKDEWLDHFHLDSHYIRPLTPEGRVTIFLLRLNDAERVEERAVLIRLNRYP